MSFNNSPTSQDPPKSGPGPHNIAEPQMPPLTGAGNPWSPPIPHLTGQTTVAQQPWGGDTTVFNLTLSQGRVDNKNQLSEYRTGQIVLSPAGLNITGKAVLPNTTRTIVYVLCLVILRGGILIPFLIMEYALRRDRTDLFSWQDIEGVAFDREKGRVCVSYRMPDKPKVSYALGTKLDPIALEQFLRLINEYAPGKVRETKILPATPVWVWIVFGVIFTLIIVGIFLSSGSRP